MEIAETFEMACSPKKAEQIITGLERPINEHLLKLMAMAAPEETRAHWRIELSNFYGRIADMIARRTNRTFPEEFYFRILWREPFEHAEEVNTASIVNRMIRNAERTGTPLRRNDRSDADLATSLRDFHRAASRALAAGTFTDALIDAV